jgi:hypothetical protein
MATSRLVRKMSFDGTERLIVRKEKTLDRALHPKVNKNISCSLFEYIMVYLIMFAASVLLYFGFVYISQL